MPTYIKTDIEQKLYELASRLEAHGAVEISDDSIVSKVDAVEVQMWMDVFWEEPPGVRTRLLLAANQAWAILNKIEREGDK